MLLAGNIRAGGATLKKLASWIFCIIGSGIFVFSVLHNADYFYKIANSNLILYQIKQVLSVLFLYLVGYLFLKAVQGFLSDIWVGLLAMPCGVAIWVFLGQFLFMSNITYMMHRMLILIAVCLILCFGLRKAMHVPLIGSLFPKTENIAIVIGTALLVSTGFNYINMNYDSYLYFADYGRMMAWAGDYREWNTANGYVITNIGQFLPTLNSYASLWGLEYCAAIQSFMVLNMYAIFAYAVYEMQGKVRNEKVKIGYTVLFTAAVITCTCILVYGNWMLSNAFIMYYLLIMAIMGRKAPKKVAPDYILVLSGSMLAVALLRKDGIIIVCFMAVCYCCNMIMNEKLLVMSMLPAVIAQIYYIGYVRLFLGAQTATARGTSILNNKFVFMICGCIVLTVVYIMWVHPLLVKWMRDNVFLCLLCGMIAVVIVAVLMKFTVSIEHIDAVFHVLLSEAYGISIVVWLLLLAMILTKKISVDYEIFLLAGYCMLAFLIYWNKGNTEQGIDNSGMRMFVQIAPVIYYVAADKLKEVIGKGLEG